jgi:hypothetical protein
MKKVIAFHLFMGICYIVWAVNVWHHAHWSVVGFVCGGLFRWWAKDFAADAMKAKGRSA